MRRAQVAGLAAIGLLMAGAGCWRPGASSGGFALVIGQPGHTSGKFNRPRGIARSGFRAGAAMRTSELRACVVTSISASLRAIV